MRKLTFRATLAAVLAVLLFASALTIPVAAGTIGHEKIRLNITGQKATVRKTSTVCAGEIRVNDEVAVRYLYSEDITRSAEVFGALREAFREMSDGGGFAELVPELAEKEPDPGLAACSDDGYADKMNDSWRNASDVGRLLYPDLQAVEPSSSDLFTLDGGFAAGCAKQWKDVDIVDDAGNDCRLSGPLGVLNAVFSDTVTYTVEDGVLIKHIDRLIDYDCESVGVVITKVNMRDPGYSPTLFDDVPPGAYYEDAVYSAVRRGITVGTAPSKFSPDSGCTRAQVVTFLWRAAGKPSPAATDNPFSDVKPEDYFYDAVLWAVEKKLTAGTTKSTFSPDEVCTRGQIVTFLWRRAAVSEAKSDNPFDDVKKSDYFYDAVIWAVDRNVTKGTSPTKFSPEAVCTRAQIVTFIYRAG
ncbi:MAG: S-layer homology domain-containing protein [Clostridia bacterium]|nr:S-layer homology domain-containing protein [Clostridia bacterium]